MHNYQQKLAEQLRRLQVDKEALRNIKQEAKDAGLPTDVIALYEKLAKKGDRGAVHFLEQLGFVAGANGLVGPQAGFTFYEASEEDLHRAGVRKASGDGWDAGRGGLDADANPHQHGTAEAQAWHTWWKNGRAGATYARGGVEPARADKAQPKARKRSKVEAKSLPAPVSEPEPAPVVELEPEPEEEFVARDIIHEPPPKKTRAKRQLTNGKANPKSMPLKKRGRPPGSKNRPKEARV